MEVSARIPDTDLVGSGHRDRWAAGRPWTRRTAAAAVLVGVVTVVFVWTFRTYIVPTDPWHYIQSALHFPDRNWVPLGFTRYGMIVPLLPLGAVFGNSEVVYYVWPLVGSGLLTASLFLLSRRFFGVLPGLLAVLLGVISPITVVNLSRGYPDVLSTGVIGLVLVLAFVARDHVVAVGRAPSGLLLAIGFGLGWAFETRETSILTWPVVLMVLLGRGALLRALPRALLWVAAGITVWVVTDLAIGQFGYGDALMRVHAFTRQDLATTTNGGDITAAEQLVGRSRWFYLAEVPRLLATATVGGRWTLLIGAVALTGLAFRGGARFCSILFVVTFFGFVGVTGGFLPDHPSGRIDVSRYWIGFLPWAGLAAAGALAEIARRLTPRLQRVRQRSDEPTGDSTGSTKQVRLTGRAVFLILAVLLTAGPAVPFVQELRTNQTMTVNGGDQLAELRSHLAATESKPVTLYSDWYTIRLLPIYQRGPFGGPDLWHGRLISLTAPNAKPRAGDLVAINSLNNQSCPFCNLIIAQWNRTRGPVPRDWKPVWASTNRNLVLYQVR